MDMLCLSLDLYLELLCLEWVAIIYVTILHFKISNLNN